MIIGNLSSNKFKAKAICEDQTVYNAVFTRHGSLMMSAVTKIDQQNIFFENMQLPTKFILLEFDLLAIDYYSQIDCSLMLLLRTPSYSNQNYVASTYQSRLCKLQK